ncbi:MAG: glycosyltransferase [Chthonomonadales bacterium]
MLTTWRIRCGIAAYTEALVDALTNRLGIQVEVVPITPGLRSKEEYLEQAGRLNACDVVHIQHEYSFWGGFVPGKNRFFQVARRIRRPRVITAHTTSPLEQLIVLPEVPPNARGKDLARILYRRLRMKAVLPLLRRFRPYREWIEAAPFAWADHVIVHTHMAAEELARRSIQPGRIHVIPAGVPEATVIADGGVGFRRRFQIPDGRVISVFGYVTPFKGYELVLEALPHLPQDVVFVIAGGARTSNDEPYVRNLQQRIKAGGLERRVFVTGFLSDVEASGAMAASEIVLLPHTVATGSYSVTLPLAHGKAMVASDLACFAELARSAGCVDLFRAGDAGHLAERIRAVLEDDAYRIRLAGAAAAYAADNSWTRVAERTLEVYRAAACLHDTHGQAGLSATS